MCWANGDAWDKAGGETEQGMATRVGVFEGTFTSWGSLKSDLSVADLVLGIKA